jgi:hypothetical protein
VANSGDYYLGPLSQTQVSAEERRVLLQPVWQGKQALKRVSRPGVEGEDDELVAEGFNRDVDMEDTVEGQQVRWTERRWLVRSQAYAEGQHQQLQRRLETGSAHAPLTRV